jgi:hypothetical protein
MITKGIIKESVNSPLDVYLVDKKWREYANPIAIIEEKRRY